MSADMANISRRGQSGMDHDEKMRSVQRKHFAIINIYMLFQYIHTDADSLK